VKVPRAIEKILPRERLMEIAVKSSICKVKWKANRCNSLEDYVNLAFSQSEFFPYSWISISPAQVKEEIMGVSENFIKKKITIHLVYIRRVCAVLGVVTLNGTSYLTILVCIRLNFARHFRKVERSKVRVL
jgi:hypothetical protein